MASSLRRKQKEHSEGATAPSLHQKQGQSNKKSVPYWTRFSYWIAGEGTQHEKRAQLDTFFMWEGCRMAKLCCRRNEQFPPLGVETEPGGEHGRTTGKNERGRSCLHVEADFPWCQNVSKLVSRHESTLKWGVSMYKNGRNSSVPCMPVHSLSLWYFVCPSTLVQVVAPSCCLRCGVQWNPQRRCSEMGA